MIRRFLATFYSDEPLEFRTEMTLDRAVASLRSATSRSIFNAIAREAATGKVTEQKVVLQRTIPLMGNSFKPFFVGRFSSESGETILRGVFTMHWMTKAFMAFWFGFCSIWTLLALYIAAAKPIELWFFPAGGLGMLFVGLAIVRFGKWLARNDQHYLCGVISKALS
jgi:hypothetical protein